MRKAALLLALALSAGTAWAQPTPDTPPMGPPPGAMAPPPGEMGGPQGQAPHGMRAKFEAANVTHDGRLTQAQAAAVGWKGVARHFPEIDHDNKGYVTEQDIRAWHQARHAEKAAAQRQQPAPGQPPNAPPPGSQPY